jgi:hypothetical protein
MSQHWPGLESRHFDLLRATKALHNEKALFTLLVTGLLAGTLALLGSSLADPKSSVFLIAGLFIFLALLVFPVGGSIAGLLLMDQARGLKPRPMRLALVDGVATALRIFSVSLIGIAVVVAFYVFLGMLLFLCKLPVIGPVLYAVLFPILVVIAGLLFFSLLVALSMAGPAIWSGASLRAALTMLWRIATTHIAELLVSLFLLALLIALAGFVVGGVLLVGTTTVLGASSSILGDSLNNLIASGFNPAAFPHDEYALAGAFGAIIGLVLLLSALVAMTMMGMNLIYLRVTADLSALQPGERTQATAPQEPWLPEPVQTAQNTPQQQPWWQQEPEQARQEPLTVTQQAPEPEPEPAPTVAAVVAALDDPTIPPAINTDDIDDIDIDDILPEILELIAATPVSLETVPPAPPETTPPEATPPEASPPEAAPPEASPLETTPPDTPEATIPAACPHCQAATRPGDRFCCQCGGKIEN